jgi:hypothetical protein
VGSLLIGLPDADRDQVRHWSDELEKLGGDLTLEELQSAAAEFATLRSYIVENIEAKRAVPGQDLLSTLLDAELDDRKAIASRDRRSAHPSHRLGTRSSDRTRDRRREPPRRRPSPPWP